MRMSLHRRSRRRTPAPRTERRARPSKMIGLITAGLVAGGIGGYLLFEVYPTVLDGQGPLAAELVRFRAFAVDTMNKQGIGPCDITIGSASFRERGCKYG